MLSPHSRSKNSQSYVLISYFSLEKLKDIFNQPKSYFSQNLRLPYYHTPEKLALHFRCITSNLPPQNIKFLQQFFWGVKNSNCTWINCIWFMYSNQINSTNAKFQPSYYTWNFKTSVKETVNVLKYFFRRILTTKTLKKFHEYFWASCGNLPRAVQIRD